MIGDVFQTLQFFELDNVGDQRGKVFTGARE